MDKIKQLIEVDAKKVSHGCYTERTAAFYFGYKVGCEKWAEITKEFAKYIFENGYEGRNSEEQLFHYVTNIFNNQIVKNETD
jgi:lysozyme family protein